MMAYTVEDKLNNPYDFSESEGDCAGGDIKTEPKFSEGGCAGGDIKTEPKFSSLKLDTELTKQIEGDDNNNKKKPLYTCVQPARHSELIPIITDKSLLGQKEIEPPISGEKKCEELSAVNTVCSSRRVVYIASEELIRRCNGMIKVPMRASMVHSLIEAYGLLKYMRIVPPVCATFEELSTFHSTDYLEFLQKIGEQEDEEKYDDEAQQYGLSYDCPVQRGVFTYAALVAGASIKAAECLLDGSSDVAINWFGGWHHAKRDCASGFCYINDIVLGIQKLRQKYDRVLYVDLDLHHGDGVEDAFCTSNKIVTVSVHKLCPGFFPGTGKLDDIGCGKGKYYSVNIPLLDGVRDEEFVPLVCRILKKVKEQFKPKAVVCQCGADGIAGDPMESFNLTPVALGKCVYFLLGWKLPTLLLGGGGYHHANTSRCWAYLTGLVLGKKLASDIPEHKYLMDYGPGYDIHVDPGNMKNQNTKEYLQHVYRKVMGNISCIS